MIASLKVNVLFPDSTVESIGLVELGGLSDDYIDFSSCQIILAETIAVIGIMELVAYMVSEKNREIRPKTLIYPLSVIYPDFFTSP